MVSLTPKDWTLLAIAFARGNPITPVQLQKSLFILGQRLPSEVGPGFYTFEAYNYGPFNKQVYVDAEELAVNGLIGFVTHPGGDWQDYVATPAGTKRASELKKATSAKSANYLSQLVQWTSEQSFPELVRWIYTNYPDYKKNSLFID